METAFARGIISGYGNPKCSNMGVAAPCFAPNDPISRQQMAKMNALAAGFSDDLTYRQATYSDMPRPTTLTDPSSFFQYVERLTMHTALGFYPPDLSQPACAVANNKPCMHPGAYATRADAWNSIYKAYIYRGSAVAGGTDYFAHVFPGRAHINNQLVGYTGVYAVVTTPNTSISAGSWIAAPVALTDYASHFTESGPQKFCWNDGSILRCEVHPYASWNTGVGNTSGGWDASRSLVAGTKYVYQTERYSGSTTRFRSYY
ncbi:MAG TPA: S-layer homology domain-containing protein, partial [Nitrososphaera sp.]|nr:S-layer homology domain-containing protein [Nitrososphaera sp.]